MMYRVIAIVCAGLALAACESNPIGCKLRLVQDARFMFKMEPVHETVRFESEPPGAEAKTSNGQTCRTPCALALPGDKTFTVTFTLNGYQPDTEKLDLVAHGRRHVAAAAQSGAGRADAAAAAADQEESDPQGKPVAKQAARQARARQARRRPRRAAADVAAARSRRPSPWPSPPPHALSKPLRIARSQRCHLRAARAPHGRHGHYPPQCLYDEQRAAESAASGWIMASEQRHIHA